MKKWFKACLAMIIAIALSGCVKVRVTIDIDKDGKATGSLTTLYSTALASMYNGTADQDSINQFLDEMVAKAKEEYPDAEVTTVQEGEGDDLYVGITAKGIPMQEDGLAIQKEGNFLTGYTYSVSFPLQEMQQGLLQETGMADQSATALKEAGVEMTMTFNLPAKPESNIGVIEGNSVVIDLMNLTADVSEASITCKTRSYLVPSAGAAALLIVLLLLSLRKKKH